MDIAPTAFPEVKILKPRRFADSRGWFAEIWNERRLSAAGIEARFVQDNMAFSSAPGTIRGLHFQQPPSAQAKLVWVTQGEVVDIVLDVRVGSPTFGRHVTVRLTAEGGEQLWIPVGFAHGYCTVTPNTLFLYKVTDFYDPDSESGVRYDDPDLGIAWPVAPANALVASKDLALPALKDAPRVFQYRP